MAPETIMPAWRAELEAKLSHVVYEERIRVGFVFENTMENA